MKWWRRDMSCVRFQDLWGHQGVKSSLILLLCQEATKHVYDFDAFHAFFQRLDPKLCRTGTCMG